MIQWFSWESLRIPQLPYVVQGSDFPFAARSDRKATAYWVVRVDCNRDGPACQVANVER